LAPRGGDALRHLIHIASINMSSAFECNLDCSVTYMRCDKSFAALIELTSSGLGNIQKELVVALDSLTRCLTECLEVEE